MGNPELTIVFDNYPGLSRLEPLWGFAAVIRAHERTILFDTGSNGRVLLRNMAALDISPSEIDLVFLSHQHWDHIGGLDSILELRPGATVVVHSGFSRHLIADLGKLCAEVVVVDAAGRRLMPGIYSTGVLASDPPEHALVLECGDGLAVVAGCSHPGIASLSGQANALVGRPVRWAIGGLHLKDADGDAIAGTIDALRALGVDHLVPTHCTGEAAREALSTAWGEGYREGGVGRHLILDGC